MMRLSGKCGALSKIGLALALLGGVTLCGSQIARADEHDFLTNYWQLAPSGHDDLINITNSNGEVPSENQVPPGTTNTGSGGSNPAGTLPNEISPDDFVSLCANIYFFNPGQQPVGACSVLVTAGGFSAVPINELVNIFNTFDSRTDVRGSIKIVVTEANFFTIGKGDPTKTSPVTNNRIGCSASGATAAFMPGDGDSDDDEPLNRNNGAENHLRAWITHTNTLGGSGLTFVSELPFSGTDEPDSDLGTMVNFFRDGSDVGNCCAPNGTALPASSGVLCEAGFYNNTGSTFP